jgi:hypothetical protein
VRKLAEVRLLTASKSVKCAWDESWECCGGIGEQRFFADFDKNRTILPCAGGTLRTSRGHAK